MELKYSLFISKVYILFNRIIVVTMYMQEGRVRI